MPAKIKCPRCEYPGPLGFNNQKPWGVHFYHSGCDGAWLYDGMWYLTEAEAWKKWLVNNPCQDEDWKAAFEAKIVRGNLQMFNHHIKKWRKKIEQGIA